MDTKQDANKNIYFPLMLGGPLYQLYLSTGLVKSALSLYKRRMIVITFISWLPLLLLAFLGGTALSGVKVPFIFDVDVHVRLLISLGLFIGAEVIAQQCMQIVVDQFIEREIIPPDVRAKFDNSVASALKLGKSYIAEFLILIGVYTVGHYTWQQSSLSGVSTWYSSMTNGQEKLTLAGYWYVYISIPIFQFIFCRWYYRIFIWWRFLWQVSRLPLQLNSLHPDRAGGLGFLVMSVYAFQLALLAHTVLLSGVIANHIWHSGQTFFDFKFEILSILLFLLFLVLTPLVFFIIPLVRTKRKGLIDYGLVACDYVNHFHSKWMEKNFKLPHESLLGSSDIQALADLSNSFNVPNEMRLLPFSNRTIMELVLLISLPLLPLLLTDIPLSAFKQVIKIFFS